MLIYVGFEEYRSCAQQSHSMPSKRTEWPMPNGNWQRVHTCCCCSLPNKQHALVATDSNSKLVEALFATYLTAQFSMQTLRKLFSTVPPTYVMESEIRFTMEVASIWLGVNWFQVFIYFCQKPIDKRKTLWKHWRVPSVPHIDQHSMNLTSSHTQQNLPAIVRNSFTNCLRTNPRMTNGWLLIQEFSSSKFV